MYHWSLFLAFALALLPHQSFAQSQHLGSLYGAHFIVDVGANPTGDVLFIARGFRPESFPLSAVYEKEYPFYQTLLEEGWIIASTSYRTNAWTTVTGGEDILNLQRHIAEEIHPIERSYLYGETMGGGVAVWLAENHPEAFQGVLALGAHLFPNPESENFSNLEVANVFRGKPKLPILFVANEEEKRSSQSYIEKAANADHVPALWVINRAGHININSKERLQALRALVNWSIGQPVKKSKDATIETSPVSDAALERGLAAGLITRIRPLYGNSYTSFVASDLERLGIDLGEQFSFTYGKQTLDVTFARAYSDVSLGEWVAFFDAEGYLQLSRNYANAAETIGAVQGKPLLLSGSRAME